MSEMRFGVIVCVGIAAAGFGLISSTEETEQWRGPVVLNPNPPDAPRQGLNWDLGVLRPTAATVAGAQAPASPCDAAGAAGKVVDFVLEAAPVEDPYAG